MKQIRQQSNKAKSQQSEARLQINIGLTGEDRARFERYKDREKLRDKTSAGYKLLMERLDQLEPAA